MKIHSQIHVGGEISVGSEKTQTSFPGPGLFLALNTCQAYRYTGIIWVSWEIMLIIDGLKEGTFFPGSDVFLAKNTFPAYRYTGIIWVSWFKRRNFFFLAPTDTNGQSWLNFSPHIFVFGHYLTPKSVKIHPIQAISNQKNFYETEIKHNYFLVGKSLL